MIICTVFINFYWLDRTKRWSQYWNRILINMDIDKEIWIYLYHIQHTGWFLTEQQWYFIIFKCDRVFFMESFSKRLYIFTFGCNLLTKTAYFYIHIVTIFNFGHNLLGVKPNLKTFSNIGNCNSFMKNLIKW